MSASLSGRKSGLGGLFYVLILVFIVGGYFLLEKMIKMPSKAERIQSVIDRTESIYSSLFTPEPKKYRVMGLPLYIRATDKGDLFWTKEFKQMITDAEAETNRIIAYESILNQSKEIRSLDLNAAADVKEIVDAGVSLYNISNYNIAAGTIFNLWVDESGEFKFSVREDEKGVKTKTYVFPDESKALALSEFVDKNVIAVDGGIISVKSRNAEIDLSYLKEAIFLEKLKKKMPADMRYILYLGNRHGMWKLPKQYIRWTVSIDNPYAVIDKQRAALKLLDDEGFFVISRRSEKYIEIGDKRYEFPIDWRNGRAPSNLSALVVDKSAVKARMLSYSLLISDNSDVAAFEKNFPQTPFLVLKSDDTVYVSPKYREIYLSLEDMKKAAIEDQKRKDKLLNESLKFRK